MGTEQGKELVQDLLPRYARHVRRLIVELAFRLQAIIRRTASIHSRLVVYLGKDYNEDQEYFTNNLVHPTPTSFHPIAQLRNLSYFRRDNLDDQNIFQEESLGDLIRNMVHLAHIRLSDVPASFPTAPIFACSHFDQQFRSPLVVFLASLSSLRIIDFTRVHCFGLGWSQIKWQGAIEEIILARTPQLSIRGLHAFCCLVKDSLVSLSLCDTPLSISGNDRWARLSESELQSVLRLSKLRKLSVSTPYSTEFLSLFRDCHNITNIHLVANYQIRPRDIEALIEHDNPTWILLKFLLVHVVHVGKRSFRPTEISDLIAYGAEAGVVVECGRLPSDGNRLFKEYGMPIRRGYVWRPDEPSDNESEEHSEERDEGQMSDNRSEGQDEGHNIEGRRDDQSEAAHSLASCRKVRVLSPVPHRGEGGKSPKQANAIRRPKALGNPIGSEPRAAKRLRSMSGFTETDAL
ncbi:hypothetical protein PSTG_01784 [Puccinia striiformis f. sp. tritici PST-78]|uniref:Uncharacterized protein n=1 Tax=Puccinia striiformis f. sp. tritici PST-78 TaxID=1165861 RepID=A0A0L0W114_9BASI|nr:hypothetical protein PSTG_01784 [Puccinia striiformis f. sp. tritici PST-78]